MAPISVDDPDDPRLADYQNIPDASLLADRQLFIAEGRLVVRRLLSTPGWVTRSLMVTPTALAALDDTIAAAAAIPVYVVPQSLMDAVAGFNIHRGCLAVAERPAPQPWQPLASSAHRLVVLERIANADNVGSIFRHAAAFDAGGVLLGPDCADPLYRKAIRTSMGAALTVPFASLAPWPGGLAMVRTGGATIVGLTPRPDARPIREVAEALRGTRVALVAGHEGDGLTREALAACDQLARIPTTDRVDSLNVATAVAIALYEFR